MFTKPNHLTWLSLAKEHSPEEGLSLQSWKAQSCARHPEPPPYMCLEYAEKMSMQGEVASPSSISQWAKASSYCQATANVHVKQVLHGDSIPFFSGYSRNYQVSLTFLPMPGKCSSLAIISIQGKFVTKVFWQSVHACNNPSRWQ